VGRLRDWRATGRYQQMDKSALIIISHAYPSLNQVDLVS